MPAKKSPQFAPGGLGLTVQVQVEEPVQVEGPRVVVLDDGLAPAVHEKAAVDGPDSARPLPTTQGDFVGKKTTSAPVGFLATIRRRTRVTALARTRVSALARTVGGDKDGTNKKIIQQLKLWDKDGDGEITLEDIVDGARKLIEHESRASWLRRWLILSIILGAVGCAACFGITKAVVETSKETWANSEAMLTNRAGVVVSTANAETKLGLSDLTRLPIDAFKQVHRLTFRTDSGEYFTQVAFAAKTAYRLSITGQDGLEMTCTVSGCEAEFPKDHRIERMWINTTGEGRFLEEHEFPSIDMSFAGYDAERFRQLLEGAAGHPGDFSLESALARLEGGATCRDGVQIGSLAAACGMEPSTNVVVDRAAVCSRACKEAYHMIMDLCGLGGEPPAGAGRRLAESEGGARTAAELLSYIGKFSLANCGDAPKSSWTSAGGGGIGAKWFAAEPTALTLTESATGRAFLTQTIRGVRLLQASGQLVDGTAPLIFTSENSWVDTVETTGADFVTIYSVLPLGEKSALRVVVSQLLSKVSQTVKTAQIGPTSVCLGPIDPESGTCVAKTVDEGHLKFSMFIEAVGDSFVLPSTAAKLGVVLGLNPADDADLVLVPVEDDSGAGSLARLVMERSDGSKLWKYKFEQSFNIDNAITSTNLTVAPTMPLNGTTTGVRELHVQVALSIGGALRGAGSFVMYDPETFSGSEKLLASHMDTSEEIELDEIAVAAAALVYSKFERMAYLFRKSRKLAGWQQVRFTGNHICATNGDSDIGVAGYNTTLCTNGGGKFGAMHGLYKGERIGLVAFAGTDDAADARDDMCAGIGGNTVRMHGKDVASGFHRSYMQIREHLKAVLVDLKNAGAQKIMFTGHSLGGALASIATWEVYNSYDLAGGYFKNKHLRTVTAGEPAPWNYPQVPFSNVRETKRTVSSSGRRRAECDSGQRRRFWSVAECDPSLEWITDVSVTPDAAFTNKYHRYITSVRQTSTLCYFWEYGVFGIRGLADIWKYLCEVWDWDLVAGLATLSGSGVHATRATYWIAFDATKVGVQASEVINLYKEDQTETEFLVQWLAADIAAAVPLFLQSFFARFVCSKPTGDRRLDKAKDSAPSRGLDERKSRRLGISQRIALHNQFVYYYWMTRAVCEEKDVPACDCPFFCLAWAIVKEETSNCIKSPTYNVCEQSTTDHFESDYMSKPNKCNCQAILVG